MELLAPHTLPSATAAPASAGRTVLAGRLFLLVSLAFWLGGLTFYAAVVIPTGVRVLGSHTQQGFVTQQVTQWVNLTGACVLSVLLLHILLTPRRSSGRAWLARTWLVMAVLQAGLFALHPVLDRQLDIVAHVILDPARFYAWHRVYLFSSTVQGVVGLMHVWAVLRAWSRPGPLPRSRPTEM